MLPNPTFWEGRKVFVTGHTGFKGGWLSLWLSSLGAQIAGYSFAPTEAQPLFMMADLEKLVNHNVGDIRDFDTLQSAITDFNPEVVFHMAAQPLVRESYTHPRETFSTNVMGTVNILDAARCCPSIKAILNITTDKVYENNEWEWPYREHDRLGGHDPYSNSKACSELVTASFRKSFYHQSEVGLATARAGNVIGGGDYSKDRLVPDVFRALSSQEPIKLRYPNATRPWQHVLEPLRGYLLLAEELYDTDTDAAESWNFGPSESGVRSVRWVTEFLLSLAGRPDQLLLDSEAHFHEARLLSLDVSRARTCLGWEPSLSIEQALEFTYEWEQRVQSGEDTQQILLSQIAQYCQIVQGKGLA